MNELIKAMLEDVKEAATLAELAKLEALIPEYPAVDVPAVRGSIEERRIALSSFDPSIEVVRLLSQLQELKNERRPAPLPKVQMPNTRKYRLVKADCSWTKKPQVHVLMEIIKSVCNEGDVVSEETILEAVEANKELLNTQQPSERIFHYYKGTGGFIEHGNLVKEY